jgi:hypothetical protein
MLSAKKGTHVKNIIVELVSFGWREGEWRDARTGKKKNFLSLDHVGTN